MNKLKSINIKNYKCFKNTSFSVKDIMVLIGENNAGKSTVIEAIKLIAFGIEKVTKSVMRQCPIEISNNLRDKCVVLNIDNLMIDISLATYKYQKGTSKITGFFDGGISIVIYIINENVYAQVLHNNSTVNTTLEVKKLNFPQIFVMPHFNLLREEEGFIDEKRTKHDRFNYRTSLHFRNELLEYEDKLEELNSLLAKTWVGFNIEKPDRNIDTSNIIVLVRNNDFSAEIKKYGSGLQMWVQIIWFLCKVSVTECIIVLDEPDVYIHADLQRKLFDMVIEKYSQVIIATHSIEIINEAELSDILIVDKTKSSLTYCKNKYGLLNACINIGSGQNLLLTKLHRTNKVIFVEGKDIDILDGLYKKWTNNTMHSLKDYVVCQLNGKNNYRDSFGAAKIFHDDSDGIFKTFCILDKDYDEEFNKKIRDDALNNNIKLFILERLEIENYLICPSIISRILNISENNVKKKILELAQGLKGQSFDRILEAKVIESKKIKAVDIKKISLETRMFFEQHWTSFEEIIKIVPGKELKGLIYDWINKDYKISLNDKKVISLFELDEIPSDLIELFTAIRE